MQDHGMTRYRVQMLRALVARGAEWLDRHVRVDWPEYLLGFFGRIAMEDASNCIVGTLVRDSFVNGIEGSTGGEKFEAFLTKHGLGTGGGHGFNLPNFLSENDNAEALRDGLNQPESGNYTPPGPQWTVLMEAWEHEVLLRVTPEGVAATIGRLQGQLLALPQVDEAKQRAVRAAERELDDANEALEDAEREQDDASEAVSEAKEKHENAKAAYREAMEAAESAEQALADAREAAGPAPEQAEREKQGIRYAIQRLDQYLRERNVMVTIA